VSGPPYPQGPFVKVRASQRGNDLRPDRDHSKKQRKRGKGGSLFGKYSEHSQLSP